MNIAIFADLHGRIRLCFKLCARWEKETGEQIDLILQAGDLGAYPNIDNLDRATIKHMRDDPSELGFSSNFTQHKLDLADELAKTTCPLLFVRGNHEDHDWLDKLEAKSEDTIFPVDVYRRVFCMKTGIPYTYSKNGNTVTILGIGRIAPLPGDPDINKPKYIQSYERERIYSPRDLHCDILLTHDTALDFLTPNYGMEEIRLILDSYTPTYHFHGHTEEALTERLDDNQQTRTVKMTDLHWDKSTHLWTVERGAMGILRWHSPTQNDFSIVDADWFFEYNAKSWESIS